MECRLQELPIDLVENILFRLEVQDLGRLKAVSRAWFDLISSPSFICTHLLFQQSKKSNDTFIAKTDLGPDKDGYYKLMSFSPEGPESKVYVPPSAKPTDKMTLVGSCNGLLCLLYQAKDQLFLWNPTTKESVILSTGPHILYGIGFGYDATSGGDYKIVTISKPPQIGYAVEVWSMSTHRWREISDWLPNLVKTNQALSGLQVGRNLYWLARKQAQVAKKPVVFSFDMADETFRPIELPDVPDAIPGSNIRPLPWILVDFQGRLHICRDSIPNERGISFDIWMLESEEAGTWTKRFTIGPFKERTYLTGLCINDKFFMRNRIDFLLDPLTREEKELKGKSNLSLVSILEFNSSNGPCQYWSFTPSLVSVKPKEMKK